MESISKIALLFLYTFLWFSYCGARVDEPLTASSAVKLKCMCTSDRLGNFNYSPTSNCSSSCDCSPVKGSDGIGWTCLCASGQSPQISDSSCFTACNCTSDSISETEKKRATNKLVVAILLLCVVLTTIAFLASLVWYFYRKDRHLTPSITPSSSHKNDAGDFIQRVSSCLFITKRGKVPGTITRFSYIELEKATSKFSSDNLIGLGGSSNVYRAQLKDGRVVAVKRLNMHEGGGSNSESGFLSEIELISRLNHCHLVSLLGYCLESQGKKNIKLLVFEYMGSGNLRDCLDVTTAHCKHSLDWNTRVSIALGVARGLEYLHESACPRILHRDVKSTNILLDDKFIPKITDLGMAKRLSPDGLTSCTSCTSSPARMMGTFGYFAPEYAIVGRGSLKSDIFSFGVVILELITGRKPVHKSCKKGDESLVLWATPRLQDSKLVISDLPDPLLKGKFPQEEIQIMAHLAKECLQWDPDSRPSMSEVVQILSTVSLDKAKPRRNLSINLVLSSAVRGSSTAETCDEISVEREEMGQIERWKATMCSLPSSESPSWEQVYEDGPVDLTEPRFESFVQKTSLIH